MFKHISKVLNNQELQLVLDFVKSSNFLEGKINAGTQAKEVKNNLEIINTYQEKAQRKQIESVIINALNRNHQFQSFTLPKTIYTILFSKYEPTMEYGYHVDNPIMKSNGKRRSDLSWTLFLSPPESYEGGELQLKTAFGEMKLKFNQGDIVVYPSTTIHRVNKVTKGVRLVAVGWLQSIIKDPIQREIIYDLNNLGKSLNEKIPLSEETLLLSKIQANLIRMWSEI